MFSKPLAFGLLALGCLTAAAGGAYVATRHNTVDVVTAASQPSAPSSTTAPAAAQPVAETEAPVAAEKPAAADTPAPAPSPRAEADSTAAPAAVRHAVVEKPRTTRPPATAAPTPAAPRRTVPSRDSQPTQTPTETVSQLPAAAPPLPAPVDVPVRPAEPQPEPARVPQFEEVVLPAASVIGLQVETPLSSERARIEDRVEARVTRDVIANGRVAIPAGSRVLGSVTLVDKGGKLKERARLGIRFHTLVLADGTDVALHTEPFYRDGESPAGDSAKKIGGAAIGGAILGAILGGGKGAVVGGTTGGAAGTAAVMAGDRNPATIAPGSIVSVRLAAPVTMQVEKRDVQ